MNAKTFFPPKCCRHTVHVRLTNMTLNDTNPRDQSILLTWLMARTQNMGDVILQILSSLFIIYPDIYLEL